MTVAVDDVAAFLLRNLGQMSTWRLQKLLYYAQAWHLARYDVPLFDDEIQAWAQGPVVPAIYYGHRGRFGVTNWPRGNANRLDHHAAEHVSWVVQRYGQFSGEELSRFTHAEAPWNLTRGRLPEGAQSEAAIPRELMRDYYRRQVMAPDVAVDAAVGSARLEGFEFDDRDVARMRDVATGRRTGDDVVAEILAEYRGSGRGT